jgi:hypothetical protein
MRTARFAAVFVALTLLMLAAGIRSASATDPSPIIVLTPVHGGNGIAGTNLNPPCSG